MVCKNNKKNRRRTAFYGISKFDYEVREKLVKEQLPLKEIPKEKKVKYNPGNARVEV